MNNCNIVFTVVLFVDVYMKKIIKFIIINIVLLLIIFLLIDFLIQFSLRSDVPDDFTHRYLLIKYNNSVEHYEERARKPVGLEYTDKKPIMIYGCSFAYGYNIKNNRHPGIILSELTKRPVYNWGISGKGLQEALFIIRNQKQITPPPEFVIYIYSSDQFRRLFVVNHILSGEIFLKYKNENNKIIFENNKTDFITNTYLYRVLRNKYILLYFLKQKKTLKILKLFIKEIDKEIHEKYPDSKFLFIVYDFIQLDKEELKSMENSKFEVIYLSDLFGDLLEKPEYKIPNDDHPNEKAWNLIWPKLIEMEKM